MIKGKKLFITGGAGFIGTSLIKRLIADNEVIVYDNLSRNALKDSGLWNHLNLKIIQGDILDYELLKASIPKDVDLILHMAAIAGIDTVIKNRVKTMEVNMVGTYHILKVLQERNLIENLERFINFSTSEVFGINAFRVDEKSPTNLQPVGEARWTYSVSKLAGEHLTYSYHKQFGLRAVTVRPFNVYGPGQVGEGAIHHFVVRAIKNEPLTVHGEGDQIRSWCYIDDMIDGILLCLEKEEAIGEVFNIGNPKGTITILGLAEKVIQLAHSSSRIVHVPKTYVDVELRIPSIEKAKNLLGFEPKVDLNEGIKRTIEWYKSKIGVMSEKIRLSRPYLGDKRSLMNLVEEVLESGFLVQGKYVAQFEQQVAEYLGIKHAVAVSSGTAALHLSLIALGIGPGDEVIVPAYTFPATANVVELVRAKPVLVDVDLETYNLLVDQIEKSLTPKTKAIILVHLFGNPADMDPIIEMAKKHNLWVIEDAAGALGSTYKGRKCGTIGHLGCFSFHPRKIVTTGEGGMVVTNDNDLAEQIRSLRNHGMRTIGSKLDFIAAGFNYRMNELEAVLGIVQMREIQEIISERQRLAGLYMDILKSVSGIAFQKILPNCTTVWQAFVVQFRDKNRDRILQLLRGTNIEGNIGTYALHLLHFYSSKYGYKPCDCPNAAELYSRSLALPFYGNMSLENIEQVVDVLRRIIDEN